MKRRGLGSPDVADAAALTFAFPVVPKGFANTRSTNYQSHKSEYDPIELEAA